MSTRVFLSYSRSDTAWAERIRLRLTDVGLASFLDRYGLPAGQAWQPQLEAQITASACVLVLCGRSGIGNWQQREISLALDRQASSPNFPVIPVLLPGLEEPPLGSFLSLNTWVDLRTNPDDPHAWQALIAGAAGRAIDNAEERLLGTVCPYRGLQAFREEDAGLFFGRSQAIETLISKATERSLHNAVCVIGNSGSGKSSIVLAGLVPALRRSRGVGEQLIWEVLSLTPGSEPLQALVQLFEQTRETAGSALTIARLNEAAALLRDGRITLGQLVRQYLSEADKQGTDRLLLVVDQWEELYTQAESRDEPRNTDARRFIDIVLDAAASAPMTLVFTVRADFYDRLIAHPRLTEVLANSLVSVGPLTRQDVIDAIEEPARALGYDVQPQLTQLLLADLGFASDHAGDASYDAGRLPLLEFALERVWHKARAARRSTLQAQDYVDVGRLEGALEAAATIQYARLSPPAKIAAKRLFLSLMSPGSGRAAARLRTAVPSDAATAEVLSAFASPEARLIITGADATYPGTRFAQVTHEALLRHWALLRDWVQQHAEVLGWRDQIREAMLRWRENSEAPDYLLPRGLQLELGRALVARRDELLIDDLVAYISQSIELDNMSRRAERRRLRRWVAGLAGAALAATLGAGGALFFYSAARDKAAAALAAAHRAEEKTWQALGALARGYLYVGDPSTALLLALRAVPAAGAVDEHDRQVIDAAAGTIWNALANNREVVALPSRQGSVYDLAASSDGSLAVSGGSDGSVQLWRRLDGTWTNERLAQHDGHVNAVALSSDLRWVAAAGADGIIRVWSVSGAEKPVVLNGHTGRVRALEFSGDNQVIVSAGEDGTARIWDIETQREVGRSSVHGRHGVWSVSISPDGTLIASAADDETIKVWKRNHPDEEPVVLRGHKGSVMSVAFSPDGTVIASGGWDGTVRIWPVGEKQQPVILHGHDGRVQMVRFSADSARVISAGEDGTIRIWARDSIAAPLILRGHEGGVWSARLTQDGTTLVSGGMDGTVRVWQVDRAPQPTHTQKHHSPITTVAYSPDGQQLASGAEDGQVILHAPHDPRFGRGLVDGQQSGRVKALVFSPNGTQLASAHADGKVRIWATQNSVDDEQVGRPLYTLSHGATLTGVVFGTDETILYTAGIDGTVRRWDGVAARRLYESETPIQSLSASPDRRWLAAGDEKGRVLIWDLEKRSHLRILSGIHAPVRALAFSPDGEKLLVAGSRGQVSIIYHTQNDRVDDLVGQIGEVTSAAFGPLNARIATAGADGAIRIWHLSSSRDAWVQRAHDDSVIAIAFSPDGTHLVSGGADRVMRVWYLGRSFDELVARACAILPRDLTAAQRRRLGINQDASWPCSSRAATLWPNTDPVMPSVSAATIE